MMIIPYSAVLERCIGNPCIMVIMMMKIKIMKIMMSMMMTILMMIIRSFGAVHRKSMYHGDHDFED